MAIIGSVAGAIIGAVLSASWILYMAVWDDRISWEQAVDRVFLHPTGRYEAFILFEMVPAIANGVLGGLLGKLRASRSWLAPLASIPVVYLLTLRKNPLLVMISFVPACIAWLAGDVAHHFAARQRKGSNREDTVVLKTDIEE